MARFLTALLFVGFSFSMNAQVIISGIMDGDRTGGHPKFIELLVTAPVADMSIYTIKKYSNANTTAGGSITLTAVPGLAGDYIYIASNAAEFLAYMGFDAQFVSSVSNNNGDDTVVLEENGTEVDIYGEVGTDGTGEDWEYKDSYAIRSGTSPSTTWMVGDWAISSVDGCGSTNAACPNQFPSRTQFFPIELVQFTATQQGGNIVLSWGTASELDNKEFIVERASASTFEKIATIQGAGTAEVAQNYSYVDTKPNTGTNYYRLRQVDYDGSASLSHIIEVSVKGAHTGVAIFPNPAFDFVQIDLGTASTSARTFALLDATGRIVQNIHIEAGTQSVKLDVTGYAEGMYMLIEEQNGVQQSYRFIKK